MSKENLVTGRLLFLDAGIKDGKKLFSVSGVMSLPMDTGVKPHHVIEVIGNEYSDLMSIEVEMVWADQKDIKSFSDKEKLKLFTKAF